VFYLQKYGGISVYWNELITYLINHKINETRYLEILAEQSKYNERTTISKDQILYDRRLPLEVLRYLPIHNVRISAPAIIHSSYYRYSKDANIKNIITVYDFTYEYFRKGIAKFIHHLQKGYAIKNADGIICISESTKNDLLKYYPNTDKRKIKVIHLASSDSFYKKNSIQIRNRYFNQYSNKKIISFVGNRIYYKNFMVAIEVIKRLPSEYHLLIIGGGNLTTREKQSLLSVTDKYTHLNNINTNELNDIYNMSFCYLYPSEYEGFGIPILEAMQAGCPVICQHKSSIPEVYGIVENIVQKVNDINEYCLNIRKLENSKYRKKIIKQGYENSKNFSWEKTCTETIEFYKYIETL